MLPEDEKENQETQTQNEPETQTNDDQPSQDDQPETQPQAKADWKVEKYGPDWENSVEYWKDTSGYWRGETDKEKKKRQQRSSLEDLDRPAPATVAKPNVVAKENGNGNGNGANAQGGDADIQTVKELLEHVNKNNEQFFENKFNERLDSHQKESNFRSSMERARREDKGDPDIGIPSFAELEQDVLVPLCEKTPAILKLLRELPGDPGQNAYTLAILVKTGNVHGLRDLFQRQGRDQLAKKIDDVSKEAVRVKTGKSGPTSAKLSPEEIKNMSSADFEKLVAQNTGRG